MSLLKRFINYILDLLDGKLTDEELNKALDELAAKSSEKLDWKNSIVDLMKLTGHDSSLAARKELADDLGYDGQFTGTAEQNIWLHKQVMEELSREL